GLRELEQPPRAFAVDPQGLERQARVTGGTGRACEMVDAVEPGQRGQLVYDVGAQEAEARLAEDRGQGLAAPGDPGVGADHLVPAREQLGAEVRSDHAGSAGDENAHGRVRTAIRAAPVGATNAGGAPDDGGRLPAGGGTSPGGERDRDRFWTGRGA